MKLTTELYQQQLDKLSALREVITLFLSEVFVLNVVCKVTVHPRSEHELSERKERIDHLYTLAEKNFTELFVSGMLHEYIVPTEGAGQEQTELENLGKQVMTQYRALYNLVQQYIHFKLESLETLYCINGFWIWELDTAHLQEKELDTPFDETKAWMMRNGKPTNIDMDATGLPIVDEIMYKSSLQQMLGTKIMATAHREQGLLAQLNADAISLRTSLVAFISSFEDFEVQVLQGLTTRTQGASKSQKLSALMKERS